MIFNLAFHPNKRIFVGKSLYLLLFGQASVIVGGEWVLIKKIRMTTILFKRQERF
jgi:hypothetical protein